ncbi:Ger(x)C family spore germination protein [Paenibacillus radicis (ex Gao et al. 2016)]|uniref:Spore germination protein KC n=1 Tax=Paenibacillus radicis (ex Gao et al. 2016) TaxID=1737354 RepID=A0A917H183_9BACL|nr:Ger(x)C family spore germination protein [Paenibacillus radicis (ex Gao et al. 2016)]GGG64162.1 spore germination protein KC [Paenibacillus radicis (ex Gao et al. 2016)]
MFYKMMVVLLCLLMLSGCWSRRELNELLIVLGIGFDWVDGEYLVSFQVVNPSEISAQKRGGERPPSTLYQGRGKTMLEAARSLTAEAPRKVYMGHLQLYVISEELARMGIGDFIDNALRDNEHRMDFKLVVARGMRAEDILKLYTPLDKLPTNSMLRSLETSEKNWAPTVSVTMDDVLKKLSADGTELALTGIKLIGSQEMAESKRNVETFLPQSRYRYKGIAAFKGDKLAGWLNETESKGYTDITDKLQSTSIEIPCKKDTFIGIEVTSSNSSIESKIVGGEPEFTIHIRSEGNIVERGCRDVDITDPATIEKLEREADEIIQGNAEAAVKRAKSMKSDFLGFGAQLNKDHPSVWKQVNKDWNDTYLPDLKIRYKIKMLIRKTGTTGNSTLK